MKKKLIILLVAIATMVGVMAQTAGATDRTDISIDVSSGSGYPFNLSPYYGTAVGAGVYHIYDSNYELSTYQVTLGVGADYGQYPTTWAYPSPGISAGWLTARVSLQYTDANPPGVPQGNCGVYDVSNALHVYSAASDHTWDLTQCDHRYVQAYFRGYTNAGGLGSHNEEWAGYGWQQNLWWGCEHGTVNPCHS